MSRRPILLAAIVVTSLFATGALAAGTAAGQSQAVFLSIDTSTSPDQPTTEDAFDLHVNVSSADAGTTTAYISQIRLVNGTGDDRETIARNYSVGRVAPGGSIAETMAVELDEEGTYDMRLELQVRAAGRNYQVTEPVTVRVYDSHPVLEASAAQSMPGRFTDLDLRLGNGLGERIRNVEVSLASDAVEIEDPRRVRSVIEAGATANLSFRARAGTAGEQPIQATIRYTDGDGERRHVTRTLRPTFAQPELADELRVSGQVEPTFPGSRTTLNLTVSNGMDVGLRQLEVRVAGEGVAISQPERVSGGIGSGETRTYAFSVERETAGAQPFDVELAYVTEDGAVGTLTRTVQTAFETPENPGEVTLTGLQVEREGDTLAVSGTASNVGGSEVSGVTVAVDDTDSVAPGRSQAEYFVGSIAASDFVSFDVNARLLTNATSADVPLVVSYTVDGVRQEVPVTVQYEAEPEPTDQQGSTLPLVPGIGVIVVLALIAAGVLYWRRR